LLEASGADAAVVFTQPVDGEPRVVAFAGCDAQTAQRLAATRPPGQAYGAVGRVVVEPLGRDAGGARYVAVASPRAFGDWMVRRVR
jgi:hypothetical protein